MNKTTAVIITAIVALLIGIAGTYVYMNSQNDDKISTLNSQIDELQSGSETCALSTTPTSTATTPATDETANWKTYTNEEYGFSFKYPEDWGEPTLQTDKPSTDPVEVIGYSNKITFPANLENSVTIGFSTTDFSAPRHANYWESAPKTGATCAELETNPVVIEGSCSKLNKGFITKFNWFGDEPIVGMIFSGYTDYPVFTVSPAEIVNQKYADAITNRILSTFQFTK